MSRPLISRQEAFQGSSIGLAGKTFEIATLPRVEDGEVLVVSNENALEEAQGK